MIDLPKNVSVAIFRESDSMFFIRANEFGEKFLQNWLDLAQGRKTPCEHRFGIYEYHDLFWLWVNTWDILDGMVKLIHFWM